MRRLACCLFTVLVLGSLGCGDPGLHEVTGKVTLGGESHERLIVYMRLKSGKADRFSRGLGSTDENGVLSIGTNADGFSSGTYRVTFSYREAPEGEEATDGKGEDALGLVELVPPPYDDMTSSKTSPVEFVISGSGKNHFEFDIPLK